MASIRIGASSGPLAHRESLFEEELDKGDPWQFVNFRVR